MTAKLISFDFLFYEEWFHLHRRVSSQNNWFWIYANSHLIHEVDLNVFKRYSECVSVQGHNFKNLVNMLILLVLLSNTGLVSKRFCSAWR